METRAFGRTGLTVSVLGFGAGSIGEASLDEPDARRVLDEVVDLGVTLIDTARGYGLSEERIGRYLGHRRKELVLSTKGGYGVDGVADWTAEAVTRGVDDALGRLRTDWIDVFHLHSCPRDVLERGEVTLALRRACDAGKVRVAAYSGENDALGFALESGVFRALQCSVSLCDQAALDDVMPRAVERGVGVIAKRPIANAAWRFDARPAGDYAEVYWERLQAMTLERHGLDWAEYALRFSAFAPGVSSVIVGTRNAEHLRTNAAIIARGPLAPGAFDAARETFTRAAARAGGWAGQV